MDEISPIFEKWMNFGKNGRISSIFENFIHFSKNDHFQKVDDY
jgi:hypothetical protein